MKLLLTIYRFLGSVYLAIILIAITTIVVIAGTFLESYAESHLYAASFTYNNPAFLVLLGCFFVNILISALRRWPFKVKHIPFLITHLGLLLMLGGTIIKNIYGIQGTMGLIEGTSSQEIFTPHTEVLRIEKRDPNNPSALISKETSLDQLKSGLSLDRTHMKLVEYSPHSAERFETWIKGKHAYIAGMKPFPVFEWHQIENEELLPISNQVKLFSNSSKTWDVYAIKGSDVAQLAERIYIQDMKLQIISAESNQVIAQIPLNEALQKPKNFQDGVVHASLHLNYSSILGFEEPKLTIKYTYKTLKGSIDIPLFGDESLLNKNTITPYLGSAPIIIDLDRPPTLAFIQDLNGVDSLFAFDDRGRVQVEAFQTENLQSLYVIDQGFGGYAIQSDISLFPTSISRAEKENATLQKLEKALNETILSSEAELALPLQLLYHACQKTQQSFPHVLTTFLNEWNHCQGWLYPSKRPLSPQIAEVIKNLDWNELPSSMYQAAQMTSRLFDDLEPALLNRQNIMSILQQQKWPLINQLETLVKHHSSNQNETSLLILHALQEQIMAASQQIPKDMLPIYPNDTAEQQVRVFTALLRYYGIHLQTLNLAAHEEIPSSESLKLATSVTIGHQNLSPTRKMEENLAKITIQMTDGSHNEFISLSYDRFGTGLKQPIMSGKYLARFQPQFHQIPYQIRLRDARQINYPGTSQPYSYEADLVVKDIVNGITQEKTISMNNVHETWDGYRFYLANISPSLETSAQRVQIIVNYDPAKYFMTYPGAMCVALGIILLFWMRPYGKGMKETLK